MNRKDAFPPAPEFSHIVALNQISDVPKIVQLDVPQAMAVRLATRFALDALADMHVTAQLVRQSANVHLTGTVTAVVTYRCRVSNQPFCQPVTAEMDLLFCPSELPINALEIELDTHDLDIEPLDPQGVDIGEAAAQTLGLSLDPWPRAPDADQKKNQLGIQSEDEAARRRNPFSILKDGPANQ